VLLDHIRNGYISLPVRNQLSLW